MSAYTERRNREKAKSRLATPPPAPTDAEEARERATFITTRNGELHVRVLSSSGGHFFTALVRLSKIKQDPETFCKRAGVRYIRRLGMESPELVRYIRDNQTYL